MGEPLANPPLVEALVDLRWKLDEPQPGVQRDPAYPLFLGRLHERIRDRFPVVEPLPVMMFPDVLTPHMVKYRFRAAKDEWPLVQAGPGVASLNFSTRYEWKTFREYAQDFFTALTEARRNGGASEPPSKFVSVLLRYINAREFDYSGNDSLRFLNDQLHTHVTLPDKIAGLDRVVGHAQPFHFAVCYPLAHPVGRGEVCVRTGTKDNKPAIVWDLSILSVDDDVPQTSDDFVTWLGEAHAVIDDWFFALIDGSLLDEFRGGLAR